MIKTGGYRLVVLRHLPALTKLDNDEITPEEREAAKSIVFDLGEQKPKTPPQPSLQSRSKLEKEPKSMPIISKTADSFSKPPSYPLLAESISARQQSILSAISQLSAHLDLSSLEAAKHEVDRLLQGK